ncbi:MAG: hypothetical protein QM820_19580 [Minicystis sp.]
MELVVDLWHLAFANLHVAVTDEVAEAEHDEFLRIFSHRRGVAPEAARWMRHWIKETKMTQKIEETPGYDDIFEKILEEMPPGKRLLGMTPEQQNPCPLGRGHPPAPRQLPPHPLDRDTAGHPQAHRSSRLTPPGETASPRAGPTRSKVGSAVPAPILV